MLVPLARLARRGEAIRIGAVRNRPTSRRPREPRVGRRGWRALARDRPAAWPDGRAPRAATGSPIRCAPQGAGPCQPAAARPRPWPAEASKSNAEARGLTGRELPSHWPCSLTRATRGSVKLTRRKSTQKPRARIGRVMPIYEYECHGCRRRVSLLVLRPSAAEPPTCPKCGSSALSRLMSRFATVKSEDARLDALADSASLGDLDENNPSSVARFMKKMGREFGDDLGDDFESAMDEAMAEGEGAGGGEGDGEGDGDGESPGTSDASPDE